LRASAARYHVPSRASSIEPPPDQLTRRILSARITIWRHAFPLLLAHGCLPYDCQRRLHSRRTYLKTASALAGVSGRRLATCRAAGPRRRRGGTLVEHSITHYHHLPALFSAALLPLLPHTPPCPSTAFNLAGTPASPSRAPRPVTHGEPTFFLLAGATCLQRMARAVRALPRVPPLQRRVPAPPLVGCGVRTPTIMPPRGS